MLGGTSASEWYDVAVVGGGATGTATAYYASRQGARTVLLERSELNTEASGRNAGSLHGQIQHEPYQQLGQDWARSWLPALQFLADSLQLWEGLSTELCADLEVKRSGGLLIADQPDQLDWMEEKAALEREAGIDSRMLTAAELKQLAPWLADGVVGGELCAVEGKANPLLVAPSFARTAASHGAEISRRTSVRTILKDGSGYVIETSRGLVHAHRVVVAAGDAMARFGRMLGLDLPISSEAVQVNVTERIQPRVDHLVYYAGGRLTFKQSATGTLLIGGGWPARRGRSGGWEINPESVRANLSTALSIAPWLADVKWLRSWVGVGNGTPDHRPILGEAPGHPGLFLGIYPYLGFTASPLMGRTLADLALGNDPDRDLTPFAPERFTHTGGD